MSQFELDADELELIISALHEAWVKATGSGRNKFDPVAMARLDALKKKLTSGN